MGRWYDGAVASVSTSIDSAPLVIMVHDTRTVSNRKVAVQTVAGVVGLFSLFVVGALWFRPWLQRAGRWFVGTLGVAGAACGVFAADSVGVPIPPDTYLAAAVTGGAPVLVTLVAVSVASVLGGQVAYWLGTKLDNWSWTRRRLDMFRRTAGPWFERWGTWTVIVAAWTPVPFSVVSTLAGAYRMPYRHFFLSTLHRAPRMVVYYFVMSLGWSSGGATGAHKQPPSVMSTNVQDTDVE